MNTTSNNPQSQYTRIQLCGPISNFPHWEETFQQLEATVSRAFEQQGITSLQILNPVNICKEFEQSSNYESFIKWGQQILEQYSLPIKSITLNNGKGDSNHLIEAYWIAIGLLTIPTVDYIVISKNVAIPTVGVGIETLWASKFNVIPIFESHIEPDELHKVLKNGCLLSQMEGKDVTIYVDPANMSIGILPTEEIRKYHNEATANKRPLSELITIPYNDDSNVQIQSITQIYHTYKEEGSLLFLPNQYSAIGFLLDFNSIKQP